ncbi:MAG: cytidine deaminase [Nitrospirae bacterium]|nr:cytidine deaminase [Nitrospirota bacterium]MDA1303243.1 cytidine deaminase [Nitrospirota bacterium]
MTESFLDIPLLIKTAEAAFQHAVAPSSGFRVGAVLQTEDGVLFTGCNIESPVYLGMCAERVALFKALSEGFRRFYALALVCEEGMACPPCGTCRQLLWEFAPSLQVITVDTGKPPQIYKIIDLLPIPFERGERDPFRTKKNSSI